jgi:hypothetical protein
MAELGCERILATDVDDCMHEWAQRNLSAYKSIKLVHVKSIDPVIPGDELFDAMVVSPAFTSEDVAVKTVGCRLRESGRAVVIAQDGSGRIDAFQNLIELKKVGGSVMTDRLMQVACEKLEEPLELKLDWQNLLQLWKSRFEAVHGRVPTRVDLVSDQEASFLFAKFSKSRKYKP